MSDATPQPPDLVAFLRWCVETGKPAKGETNHNPWPAEKIHSSDLGATISHVGGYNGDGGCLRQVWLRVHGAAKAEDGFGKSLMSLKANVIHAIYGHWMQEWLHVWSNGEWRLVELETSLYGPDSPRAGRSDALINNKDETFRWVVDFKSMRGAAFSYHKGPKPGHVLQVQDYIQRWGSGVLGAIILYTDREGQNGVLQEVARPSPGVAFSGGGSGMDSVFHDLARPDIELRWSILAVAVALPDPPPMIPPKPGKKGPELPWQCSWCSFFNVSCDGAVHGAVVEQIEGSLK